MEAKHFVSSFSPASKKLERSDYAATTATTSSSIFTVQISKVNAISPTKEKICMQPHMGESWAKITKKNWLKVAIILHLSTKWIVIQWICKRKYVKKKSYTRHATNFCSWMYTGMQKDTKYVNMSATSRAKCNLNIYWASSEICCSTWKLFYSLSTFYTTLSTLSLSFILNLVKILHQIVAEKRVIIVLFTLFLPPV